MKIDPLFLIDFYKADHRRQYRDGTTMVYSNFTPRSNKYAYKDSNEVVVFGVQGFIKEFLIQIWNENFFHRPKKEVVEEYKGLMDRCLGPDAIPVDHIADLHDFGCLPLLIKALPEGSLCPVGVPCLTVRNTEPRFFWLTNYIETLLSSELWKPMTSATTAHMYRKEFERHAEKTGSPKDFIGWQGHDFSYRGMGGYMDAAKSGAGHLVSFNGTDTVPAIKYLEEYYNTDELIGGSVPATEHSVMCMGGDGEGEFETFKRLITETYPSGIVSIVSDTWDFWKVMTEYLPRLKDEILAREGRVVIRPDSGDPVKIICGYTEDEIIREGSDIFEKGKYIPNKDSYGVEIWGSYEKGKKLTEAEVMGAYEVLYEVFDGDFNDKDYIILNPKVGLIYGDSITYDRQKEILGRLEDKGFAASNLVLGIGSFTYQFVTRDTYGFAMKATYGEVNGVGIDIYKDPKTDDGLKKSAKGLLSVQSDDTGQIYLKDQCSWEEEESGLLKPIFLEGQLITNESITEIRNRLYN